MSDEIRVDIVGNDRLSPVIEQAAQKSKSAVDSIRQNVQELTKQGIGGEGVSIRNPRIGEGETQNYIQNRNLDINESIKRLANSPQVKELEERIASLQTGGISDPAKRKVYLDRAKELYKDISGEWSKFRRELDVAGHGSLLDLKTPFEKISADPSYKEGTAVIDEMSISLENLRNKIDGVNTSSEKGRQSLPAYIGTVVNTVGQGINMMAKMYAAEKTMFDIGSPQGAVTAETQLDIFKTQQMYSGWSRIAGSIGGGVIGAATGIPGGMLAGSYLGSQITGEIGDALGTYSTADKEAHLKMLMQMWGKNQEISGVYAPLQAGNYAGARMTGLSPDEIEKISKKYVGSPEGRVAKDKEGKEYRIGVNENGLGLSQSDTQALIQQYVQSTGRFNEEDFEQYVQMYRHTGIFPGAAGNYTKLTGKSAPMEQLVGEFAKGYGITRENRKLIDDLMQSFAQNVSASARQLVSPGDITRSAITMTGLPLALWGGENPWARTTEGQTQTVQGYSALMTPKSNAEEVFLYRALDKGNMMDTILRMREGIFGKGNLQDVVKSLPQGEMGKMYAFSLLDQKGINTEVMKKMIDQLGTEEGRNGLLDKLSGMENKVQEEMQKSGTSHEEASKKVITQTFGEAPIESGAVRNSVVQERLSTEGKKVFDTISDATANWSMMVAKDASSPEVQARIREAYLNAISAYEKSLSNLGLNDTSRKYEGTPIFDQQAGGSFSFNQKGMKEWKDWMQHESEGDTNKVDLRNIPVPKGMKLNSDKRTAEDVTPSDEDRFIQKLIKGEKFNIDPQTTQVQATDPSGRKLNLTVQTYISVDSVENIPRSSRAGTFQPQN
jgi:hypothetical protein